MENMCWVLPLLPADYPSRVVQLTPLLGHGCAVLQPSTILHPQLLQAGRELGLAGETLHDAAQLLDRAGCLGLLPPAAPASPGSDGADATAGSPVATPDVALVGAALLIACKSRALPAYTAPVSLPSFLESQS